MDDKTVERRLQKTECLVLKMSKFGEMHKNITVLTPDRGILYLAAYGAAKGKSKLAGVLLPFSKLSVNLYYDPVKERYKLTDAVPLYEYRKIHSDLRRFYGANLGAEIVLKSFGSDDSVPFYPLLSEFLRVLENGEGKELKIAVIQFMWRYFVLSGFSPDFSVCSRCGTDLRSSGSVNLDPWDRETFCDGCAADRCTKIKKGTVMYLLHTMKLDFFSAMRVRLETGTEEKVILLFISLIESIIEAPIKSAELFMEMICAPS